jgi:hypothetical protein
LLPEQWADSRTTPRMVKGPHREGSTPGKDAITITETTTIHEQATSEYAACICFESKHSLKQSVERHQRPPFRPYLTDTPLSLLRLLYYLLRSPQLAVPHFGVVGLVPAWLVACISSATPEILG